MGWARYAHSMRVFVFNSGLFYIRSTPAAMELLDRVVEVVENTGGWDQVAPLASGRALANAGSAHCCGMPYCAVQYVPRPKFWTWYLWPVPEPVVIEPSSLSSFYAQSR